MRTTKRAATPIDPEVAALKVGDTIVVRGGYGRRPAEQTVTVTQVARIWITVSGGGHRDLRLRKDTQADSNAYNPYYRFETVAQREARKEREDAAEFLDGQGIDLRYKSAWRGREIELAAILRKAIEQQ